MSIDIRSSKFWFKKDFDLIYINCLHRVDVNFGERLQICIRDNGQHLSDIMFHKKYSRITWNIMYLSIKI